MGKHRIGRSHLAISILFVIALGGCSKTQRISALADRWETGQHKTCTFLIPASIVCDVPDTPVTHWDADNMRNKTSKSIVVERGEYNASFSSATPDYSVWDCHKTGADDVAINCSAIRKLSGDESQKFRTWDATELQSMEALARLKTEKDAADAQLRRCDVLSSDFYECNQSVMDSEKASTDELIRKSQEVFDALKSEAAKVGRTFDP